MSQVRWCKTSQAIQFDKQIGFVSDNFNVDTKNPFQPLSKPKKPFRARKSPIPRPLRQK